MDPQITLLRLMEALGAEDYVEARRHKADLREWIENGGFLPRFPQNLDNNSQRKSLTLFLQAVGLLTPMDD